MPENKTSKIALGGICLALTVILTAAGSIFPGIELTMFALASITTAVMILETGIGGGAILYIAAVLLGIVLVPNKAAMLPYICLFGYYGLLKFGIEKIRNAAIQITLKIIFFAAVLSVTLLGFRELFFGNINLPDIAAPLLILAGTVFLMLYDYIYTLMINFYITRIQRKGPDNIKLS